MISNKDDDDVTTVIENVDLLKVNKLLKLFIIINNIGYSTSFEVL